MGRELATTRERVLDEALRAFNERGLHAVSVREIARSLGMSAGNLAYHFPTKGHLVDALATQAHEASRERLDALPEVLTLLQVSAALRVVMAQSLDYRCIYLNYGEAMASSPETLERERTLQQRRMARTHQVVQALVVGGSLVPTAAENEHATSLGHLMNPIVRTWQQLALLSHPGNLDGALPEYANRVMFAFLPYCTDRGREELQSLHGA